MRKREFDGPLIRKISTEVYKAKLNMDNDKDAAARMLAEDNDGGVKLANRSISYDPLTLCYLRVLRNLNINSGEFTDGP